MYPRQSLTPRCSAKPTRHPAHPDVDPHAVFKRQLSLRRKVMKMMMMMTMMMMKIMQILMPTMQILMQMYTFAAPGRAQTAQLARTSLCLRRCC